MLKQLQPSQQNNHFPQKFIHNKKQIEAHKINISSNSELINGWSRFMAGQKKPQKTTDARPAFVFWLSGWLTGKKTETIWACNKTHDYFEAVLDRFK